MYCNNVTHELMHQWSAWLNPNLGLSEDGAHYKHRSNIGSLVGGQLWREPSPGTFSVICEEGRSGLHRAPLLDLYMMGLVDPGAVPPSRTYSDSLPGPLARCDQEFTDLTTTVAMQDIIAWSGPRLPGPATAQRDFSLAFVAETRDRLFNRTEMTFYDILAAWYTKPLPADAPDPYLIQNWVPITRFFGENTTWVTSIKAVVQPLLNPLNTSMAGQTTISATGFPGESYTLESSSNLTSWEPIVTLLANPASGSIQYTDKHQTITHLFYRLSWR
jgi:hypothetical protein